MLIPVLTEGVLIGAAKTGWTFFSTLWDLISKRRTTKAYEDNKKQAYRELLRGDSCNWNFVESVIAQSAQKGDVTPDAIGLKSLHTLAVSHVAKKPAAKKKAAKKLAVKKVSKKPAAKKR